MKQTTVLCYGDSNTYGYDPRTDGERYPAEVCWTRPPFRSPAILRRCTGTLWKSMAACIWTRREWKYP